MKFIIHKKEEKIKKKRIYPKLTNRVKNALLSDDNLINDEYLSEEMHGELKVCPNCHKPLTEYWKKGKRNTKRGEDKERFTCLKCGYAHTPYGIDFGMHYPESDINKFIELIKIGWTPYQIVIQNKMRISIGTAFRWEKKFFRMSKRDRHKHLLRCLFSNDTLEK